jgi:hypothetical protein
MAASRRRKCALGAAQRAVWFSLALALLAEGYSSLLSAEESGVGIISPSFRGKGDHTGRNQAVKRDVGIRELPGQ